MKKSFVSTLVLFSICAVMAVLLALTNAITAPAIKKNQEAASNKALLEVMPNGEGFEKIKTVSERTRYAFYQESDGWYRMEDGWVSAEYFYVEGTAAEDSMYGRIITDNLNIRTGPGTGYQSNGSYKKGDAVKILTQINGWGYTSKGWISMKYVK